MSLFSYLSRIFNGKRIFRYLLIACLPALLFYVGSLLSLQNSGFSLMQIIRDPAQQTGTSSLLGFVSNIGIWLWVASFVVCYFTASIKRISKRDPYRELLILAGLLSILLATDDLFMIHDRFIDQNILYILYAYIGFELFIRHTKRIVEIDGFAFFFAGFLLALSILTDLVQEKSPLGYTTMQAFEEGFKFVGAATWLYFSYQASRFYLENTGDTDNLIT